MGFATKHPWWSLIFGLVGLGAVRAGAVEIGAAYAARKAAATPSPTPTPATK